MHQSNFVKMTTWLAFLIWFIDKCNTFDRGRTPMPFVSKLPSIGIQSITTDTVNDLILSCSWSDGFRAYTKEGVTSFRIKMLHHKRMCESRSNAECRLLAPNELVGWSVPGHSRPIHDSRTCAFITRPRPSDSGVYACIFQINFLQYMKYSFWSLLSSAASQLRFGCPGPDRLSATGCLAKYEFNVTFRKPSTAATDMNRATILEQQRQLWWSDVGQYEEIRTNCVNMKVFASMVHTFGLFDSRTIVHVVLLLSIILLIGLVIHLRQNMHRKKLIYSKHRQLMQQIEQMNQPSQARLSIPPVQRSSELIASQGPAPTPATAVMVARIQATCFTSTKAGDLALPVSADEYTSSWQDRSGYEAQFSVHADEWRSVWNRKPRICFATRNKTTELENKLCKSKTRLK